MSESPKCESERRLGDFQIIREIGRGGMGTVYEARQVSLNRRVALKVLSRSLGLTWAAVKRFRREAEAAATLHHTNIVPIYATGQQGDTYYYAMELVEGPSLSQVIRQLRRATVPGPAAAMPEASEEGTAGSELPAWVTETLSCQSGITGTGRRAGESSSTLGSGPEYFEAVARMIADVADALDHTHSRGVIHRDVKPSNLLLSPHGRLSLNDFGLAHVLDQPGVTMTGEFLGSPLYMSPEQIAAGRVPVDHRTDIYSLGVTLYELLTLQPPFPGQRREQVIAQILQKDPRPPRRLNKRVPTDLQTICLKALEKDPDRRYQTAGQMAEDLRRYVSGHTIQARRPSLGRRAAKFVRRNELAVAATTLIGVLVVISAVVGWSWYAESQRRKAERWLREYALPTIERLGNEGNYIEAFALAQKARAEFPNDIDLGLLWREVASTWSVLSDPPGAKVYRKKYDDPDADWEHLGETPLQVGAARGFFRWKIVKQGYATVEGCGGPEDLQVRSTLDKRDQRDILSGMVRVPGGWWREHALEDYFIDRYEVTNRQFKRFVDNGGYRNRKHWEHPFIKDGAELSWQEAINEFVDTTNRPGPKTWVDGTYPAGEADHPVRGVSWYEAAAYAKYADKSLPTFHHWQHASGAQFSAYLIPASNLGGLHPAAVGKYQGVGPFGTYDTAGNVKEWCWNQAGGDRRFILGGAWVDPPHMFYQRDCQSAFDRLETYGFRCVKYVTPDAVPGELLAAIDAIVLEDWDYIQQQKPVSDAQFEIMTRMYLYGKKPLRAEVAHRRQTENWTHETVTFDAAYEEGERVIAHLLLPRDAAPPYQTVIFFPGVNALRAQSIRPRSYPILALIVKSGRAVLWPIYKGTYERRRKSPFGLDRQAFLTLTVQQFQDLGRSIDYLQQRKDIDPQKLAYFGDSYGATRGVVFLALEHRIKGAVLLSGGLIGGKWSEPPEAHPFNFAPRVRSPVLMLNGLKDTIYPPEVSQRPLFELLGSQEKDYRPFEVGHGIPLEIQARETLQWLDRQLGPVGRPTK